MRNSTHSSVRFGERKQSSGQGGTSNPPLTRIKMMLCNKIYSSRTRIPPIPQDFRYRSGEESVLEYKTPSVGPENENNVLTITGPIPLTTACFEFQDKRDVNVFTAHFPQSVEYSACRQAGRQAEREGGRKPWLSNLFY